MCCAGQYPWDQPTHFESRFLLSAPNAVVRLADGELFRRERRQTTDELRGANYGAGPFSNERNRALKVGRAYAKRKLLGAAVSSIYDFVVPTTLFVGPAWEAPQFLVFPFCRSNCRPMRPLENSSAYTLDSCPPPNDQIAP